MNPFKELFLLDPEIIYLNHGSYGATPRAVFDTCQAWQRQLERDPADFINNQLPPLLQTARTALGHYLNAGADELVYVPNATFGLNIIAQALPLAAGDQVLTTNHEYGSINNLWSYVCRKRGASYLRQAVSFPPASEAAMVDEIWAGVTPRTKVLFLSHITSSTALRLPVEALCRRARKAGIMTVIDGAHAPGQIALDLDALGADFYVGNCHKWLCSPKGAAFLYTRRDRQALIEPLVIGWGWGEERKPTTESDYVHSLQCMGTNDVSAYLSVPAAIEFQAQYDWPRVREHCHLLLAEALRLASVLTGLNPLYPPQGRFYEQMAVLALPPIPDLTAFNTCLYQQYGIQIPCMAWNGRQFLRISVQAYNSQEDLDTLFDALQRELPATGN